MPWQGVGAPQGQGTAMQPWLEALLQLLKEATELALTHLSKPQDSNIGRSQITSIVLSSISLSLPVQGCLLQHTVSIVAISNLQPGMLVVLLPDSSTDAPSTAYWKHGKIFTCTPISVHNDEVLLWALTCMM